VSEVNDVSLYDLLLWAEKGKTPLEQMTTEQRQAVFSALAIVVLLGIVLILVISASARMVRRYVRQIPDHKPTFDPLARGDDWARKPLVDIDDVGDDE
jgi:hypothetical protein